MRGIKILSKLGRLARLTFYLGTGAVSALGGSRAAPRPARFDGDGGPVDGEVKRVGADESVSRPWPKMGSV